MTNTATQANDFQTAFIGGFNENLHWARLSLSRALSVQAPLDLGLANPHFGIFSSFNQFYRAIRNANPESLQENLATVGNAEKIEATMNLAKIFSDQAFSYHVAKLNVALHCAGIQVDPAILKRSLQKTGETLTYSDNSSRLPYDAGDIHDTLSDIYASADIMAGLAAKAGIRHEASGTHGKAEITRNTILARVFGIQGDADAILTTARSAAETYYRKERGYTRAGKIEGILNSYQAGPEAEYQSTPFVMGSMASTLLP